jgi:NOL1/NOP2/fmu family ribosome biogenesis protein
MHFIKHKDDVLVLPNGLFDQLQILQSALYIQKAGVKAGQFAKKDLIPEHDLALSLLCASAIPTVELNYEDAIRYLQKEEIAIHSPHKGWAIMQYQTHNLGWAKVLSNRVNNYYPKEWRIRNRPPSDFPR